MNILQFLKEGGLCKSKAGHWFVLDTINDEQYPIKGWLTINGLNYRYEWTEEGLPHNLPYTHGLDLMPVIGEVSYRTINKDILKKSDNIQHFTTLANES